MSIKCPNCGASCETDQAEPGLEFKMTARTLSLIVAAITTNSNSLYAVIEKARNSSFHTEIHLIEDYIRYGNVPEKS